MALPQRRTHPDHPNDSERKADTSAADGDWRAYYQRCSEHFFEVNDAVLASAGAGALRNRALAADIDGAQVVNGAMRLVDRTLIVWLTAIALLTIAGWAV